MRIVHVVGARPNFMKLAPVYREFLRREIPQEIVHTGQHYDVNMSDVFFQQLGIPAPNVNLAVGSGSHGAQTAEIMARFESYVLENPPSAVIVYGDVNSTVAAALVCAKLLIKVVHVEAGLRSYDRTMPEEINRLVTDQLSDLLLTPSRDGSENLQREGISSDKIAFVGNVMIDTLIRLLPAAMENPVSGTPDRYGLVTLHRPSTVDDTAVLEPIVRTLADLSSDLEFVFPVHPRTRQRLEHLRFNSNTKVHFLEPQPYLQFLWLQKHATVVVTDSGGIQEETTYLGVPCLTLRPNTERPVTITVGTNQLIGYDMPRFREELVRVIHGQAKKGSIPEFWDGKASQRVVDAVMVLLGMKPDAQRVVVSAQ
jgi:UDP-N-acetylglucosamine 2-epimerase (non-hydrolysing)